MHLLKKRLNNPLVILSKNNPLVKRYDKESVDVSVACGSYLHFAGYMHEFFYFFWQANKSMYMHEFIA